MFRLFQCLAALLLMTAVAHAKDKKMPLCEIWASVEAPNVPEMLKHEMAHCWGWVHPINKTPLTAKTSAERKAFRAYVPPLRYRMKGEYPNVVIYFVSEKEAAKECGSWACTAGGLQ